MFAAIGGKFPSSSGIRAIGTTGLQVGTSVTRSCLAASNWRMLTGVSDSQYKRFANTFVISVTLYGCQRKVNLNCHDHNRTCQAWKRQQSGQLISVCAIIVYFEITGIPQIARWMILSTHHNSSAVLELIFCRWQNCGWLKSHTKNQLKWKTTEKSQ